MKKLLIILLMISSLAIAGEYDMKCRNIKVENLDYKGKWTYEVSTMERCENSVEICIRKNGYRELSLSCRAK